MELELERIFAATWPPDVLTTTIVVVSALLFGFGMTLVAMVTSLGQAGRGYIIASVVGATLLFGILHGPFMSPYQYKIDSSGIGIRRFCGEIMIPWERIESVEVVSTDAAFTSATRVWASDGVFGHFGKFSSPGLGEYDSYAVRVFDLAVVRRKNAGPILLSPDNHEEFVSFANSIKPRKSSYGGVCFE